MQPQGVAVSGRETVLRQLEEELAAVRGRRAARVLTLTGDAGSGKTTLLLEFRRRVAEHGTAHVGYGRAMGVHGMDNARQPVREALGDLVNTTQDNGHRWDRGGVLDVVRTSAPAWLGVIPIVGPVVSAVASTADATAKAVSSGHATSRLPESVNGQFCTTVAELAGRKPVALLLDDLHWADAATSDLLLVLTQALEKLPVLIVLAFRPYTGDESLVGHPSRVLVPRLQRSGTVLDMALDPLDDMGVAELFEASLGAPADPELRDWIWRRSAGNPLFVREFIDLLVHRSLLARRDGRWSLADPGHASGQLPTSLGSVLQERLSALDDDQRAFLDAAAVFGVSFNGRHAYRAADLTCDMVQLLLSLGRRGARLIVPDEVRPDRYRFGHPLFVDHLIHCLRADDPTCYRVRHSRAATVLSRHGDPDDLDWLQDMARLHREADEPADAYVYSALCADAAARSGALSTAVRHAGWAVEMADRVGRRDDRIQARVALGRLRFQSVDVDASLETLTAARDLVHQDGGRLTPELAAALGWSLSATRRWDQCRAVLEEGLRLEDDETDVRAEILMLLGSSYLFGHPRDPRVALDLLVQADTLAPGAEMRATVTRHLALCHLAVGNVLAALAACERAHVQAGRTTNPGLQFQTWLFDAYVHVALLDLGRARAAVDQLASLCRRQGIQTMDVHRLTGRVEGLGGDVERSARGWWNFLQHDLAPEMPAATRAWALSHFHLGLEELSALKGPGAVAALVEALLELLQEPGGAPPAVEVAERLRAYREALEEGDDLLTGAARRGFPLTLDPTAVAVHSAFTPDLAAARRTWGCAIDGLPGATRR